MTCKTIMTKDFKAVHEFDTVGQAAQELIGQRYINLPVIDSRGKLVGLFGIYDLLAMLVPRVAMVGDLLPNLRFMSEDIADLRKTYQSVKDKPVAEAMNREPPVVHDDTQLVELIRLFCRNHMTLPVVDEETNLLIGIVSYWDIAGAIVQPKS